MSTEPSSDDAVVETDQESAKNDPLYLIFCRIATSIGSLSAIGATYPLAASGRPLMALFAAVAGAAGLAYQGYKFGENRAWREVGESLEQNRKSRRERDEEIDKKIKALSEGTEAWMKTMDIAQSQPEPGPKVA